METTITKEKVDLDKLFPGIDTDQVLTSKVPSVLSNDADLTFLDKVEVTDETTEDTQIEPGKIPLVNTVEADKILNSVGGPHVEDEEVEDTDTDNKGTAGRPKVEKNALTNYLKDKIEAGTFSAFEDWDEKEPLDQYLSKQPEKTLYQMLDANMQAKEKEVQERIPKEFFQALSPELQYAARYEMNGGTDVRNVFAALGRIVENRALDTSTEDGQIAITRTYLQTIDFGTPEAIEEEITNWKETNRLEKKANEFKPKLDQMEKEQLDYQIAQQDEWNKQQRASAQAYMNNIHQTIQKGDLNGIKIDKKTQAALYNGLTNVSYPSASGKATNLLGHILDRIQYVEPNFELLAEVTYLLSDPEGYRNTVRQQATNTVIKETVKKLKSEQQNGTGGYETEDYEDKPIKKKLIKPKSILENWS